MTKSITRTDSHVGGDQSGTVGRRNAGIDGTGEIVGRAERIGATTSGQLLAKCFVNLFTDKVAIQLKGRMQKGKKLKMDIF